ncbi:MAG: GNAT family N-acetyltransferase [Proteobacteria bacterium]|nr:GNAT family N-acetyltransferase [Pseudomonadota bacterium]
MGVDVSHNSRYHRPHMNAQLIIREAKVDDSLAIWKLHDRSVLELWRDDYTQEQIDNWVRNSTLEKYQKRLKIHRSFVAEIDDKIVGYVRWNPATNELCSIFIDPNHVRQGIATKLMRTAYKDVVSHSVNDLWLDASLTAVPFYESEGWEYVEQKMHGPLECIRMIKSLGPGKNENL